MTLRSPSRALPSNALRSLHRFVVALATAGLMVASAAAAAQTARQDAAGRYSLTVPAGWAVASQDDRSLVLATRDASMTVTIAEGADPETIVRAVLEQVQGQWQGLQEIKRGPVQVGGQRGLFVFSSGRNPKGVPSFFRIAAVPAAGGSLVTMTSVPQEQFGDVKATLDAIEASVVLGGQAAAGTAGKPRTGPTPLSPAQQRRLAALDKALEAGVLTQMEYDEKKRAILAPVGAPPTAPVRGNAPDAGDRPFAGIAARNLEAHEKPAMRVDRGALVGQVAPGSPAEAAGVLPWDVVIAVDGEPIGDAAALVQAIGRHRPGDTVTVRVVRQGQTGEFSVRLTSAPKRP